MNNLKEIKSQVTFCSATDKKLLDDVKEGNSDAVEALITKYEGIVYKKANHYFLIGSDRDDVIQEGLIGLYKAICDYDEEKRASFKSFAELCVTRQIISCIKSATRLKHTALNSYVSIYKPASEDETDRTLLETIANDKTTEPLVWLEKKERMNTIRTHLMRALTRLEWEVLVCYLEGWSYAEISLKLDKHEKSIDNALQRIKRKMDQLINQKELLMVE